MSTSPRSSAISKVAFAKYLQEGISYKQYLEQMNEDLATNKDEKTKGYIHLNLHRMQRVNKTFVVSHNMVELIKKIRYKTWWLILTEHWCGDAAQTLPALNKIAELSEGTIEMKLLYRDQHPELMDAFLTDGTRSIPKLIQLDEHYNITCIWGPRPTAAQLLVKRLKSNPETTAKYSNELHFWYAKDKQHSLENEVSKMLTRASISYPDCLSH